MHRLPNFVVIGAQKSGTSTLCLVLKEHPDVFFCDPKEPHFFSLDDAYARGIDWYASLFADVTTQTAVGEGSTSYTMEAVRPHAAERLAAALPDARLIYIVRNPIARIESAWKHLRIKGRTRDDLPRALGRFPTLLDTSLYWKQIQRYRRHFDDDRIHVLFFEDFLADPEAELRRCCTFLDIDPAAPMGDARKPRNVSHGREVETRLGRALRRIPRPKGFTTPRPVRPLVERIRFSRFTAQPRWTKQARAHVLGQLEPDARQFLEFYGKPADYWS